MVVTGKTGARNDAVHMRMVRQILAPGVQHHDDAGLSAEITLILRKSEKCLGCRTEQKRVKQLLVREEQRIQSMRHGEDDMEVTRVKHLAATLVDPDLFEDRLAVRAAAVSARTAMKLNVTAIVTYRCVVAKLTGLAAFDRVSSSELLVRHVVMLHKPFKRISEDPANRITAIHAAPSENRKGWHTC
jgi:hypothetical protein